MKFIVGRTRRSSKEDKINHWLETYKILHNHFNLGQEFYFKRTQILMFAIQIGLATAFIKILIAVFDKSQTSYSTCSISELHPLHFALLVISLSGIVFSFIWLTMIQRHWYVSEYCRCYLRYIEGRLMELDIPLAIFRVESAIFHSQRHVFFGDKYEEDKNSFFQKEFPYEGMKAKIGLMNLEKWVVWVINLIWTICFSIFSYQSLKSGDITILECILYTCLFIVVIMSFSILSIHMLVKVLKEKKKDGLLFSVSQEFQTELGKKDISDKLRQKFVNNKIELSKNATATVKKEDNTWQIEDGHCSYTIKKESDKLNIYKGKSDQSILLWDLKEDFVKCPEKDN
jgi:hypothetical protein